MNVGDIYRLGFTNKSPAGGVVSADTMTLTIVLPDDTTVVQTITPTSAGVYQYDYLTTQVGRHVGQWIGTGANPGVSVQIFDVRSLSPGYLISLEAAKRQCKMTPTDTSNDEDLLSFIESATTAVEKIRNEAILKRTVVEDLYLPEYFRNFAGQVDFAAYPTGVIGQGRRVTVAKFPTLSLVSVARVDGTQTWDVTNLNLDVNGILEVKFGTPLSGHIQVTYTAGYRVIPEECVNAAGFIVEHLWQTRRGSKGSPTPGLGTTMVPGVGYAIPNAAIEILGGGGIPGFA
jgi:hypothetical protein